MTTRRKPRIFTHLRRAAFLQEGPALCDEQLLEHFLDRGEQPAFEVLVRRYGPMVLGVCRRVLGDPHDAADAFQATFLILVRRAASVRPGSRVGPWLYGVALRTALKARSSAARRRRAEQEAARRHALFSPAPEPEGDLRPLVDEEVARLPEKYRVPLVLCLLGDKPRREAAELLGWSEGTLSGRLARAKELLAERLRRRGVGLTTAALAEGVAGESVPSSLVTATVQASAWCAGPGAAHAVSAPVIALTEEVLRTMLRSKVQAVAAVCVLVLGMGLGIGAAGLSSGPVARGAAPPEAPERARMSRTTEGRKPAAYVIEPPDVLRVTIASTGELMPIVGLTGCWYSNDCLVRPDGTISLGELGSVHVAGLTTEQARAAIVRHRASRLSGAHSETVTVEVRATNSKVFYVIVEGDKGAEQVFRLPATGNETVLDALSQVNGLVGIGRKRISVQRKSAGGQDDQVLPVDWLAITRDGIATTNYRLLPGDRIRVGTAPKGSRGADRPAER
jgi:RNA polymerase sigma factor (sigma-70 family)